MFIFIYYLFLAICTYLLSLLFGVDFTAYTNVWTYVLVIIALLISMVLAFIIALFFIWILGHMRKNKDTMNKLNHWFANDILKLGLHLIRAKIIVSGKENIPEHNFVLIGNHQENYDIIILKPIFKDHIINFIAKESLTKMPIFGRWIKLLGNIFISKNADRSAAESIIKGIRNYKQGMSMGIFPEGKRSFSNTMIDFKPGAFKLAMKPKADILIVTQYDVCKVFKKFPWKRYKIYVHIHPLLKYDEYKELNSQELSKMVKARIQEQINKFDDMKK